MNTGSASQERLIHLDHEEKVAFIANARVHLCVGRWTAVRHQNVTVRIMSDEIAKRLHGDDGAGDWIIFGNHLLEKDLQGFQGTAAEIGKKYHVVSSASGVGHRSVRIRSL
jgi:hypothetical protein